MCISKEEIKEIVQDTMEVYYQRDRATTDSLFRDIQDKQKEMQKMILSFNDFFEKILNRLK